MPYGAIDIGTNSCRLLIAEPDGERLRTLHRTMITTRIGEGVDQQRIINPAALERTVQGLSKLGQHLSDWEVSQFRVVATSAVREAANRTCFLERVNQELHWQVEVINGEEEARLSYFGVRRGLALNRPPLVVDLGGGSTEFMLENPEPWCVSLPIGAVRATEANMDEDEIKAILSSLKADRMNGDFPLVVVGGTATTLVSMELRLQQYDSERVHGQSLTRQQVYYWRDKLAAMNLEQRKKITGLQPQRADIIGQGLVILALIMEKFGYDQLLVSESDILDGIIWDLQRTPNA